MSFLEVKNLTKSFGITQVLKGISVDLEQGQVLAVIGSSGGGKTTFMRCLNSLEAPDGGEIFVDGKQIFPAEKTAAGKQKRLTFGLVFQSFNLFPQYTAKRNVTLAMDMQSKRQLKAEGKMHLMKEYKAINEEKAMALLEQVGLAEKADFYPWQLSGGQCQRAAIARALALSPDILCFDEPTSALDPELTGEVLKVIRGLRDEGRTMIIVTHEMEFAKHVADKVIFIADGEVVEEGTPFEVFDNPQNELTKAFVRKAEE